MVPQFGSSVSSVSTIEPQKGRYKILHTFFLQLEGIKSKSDSVSSFQDLWRKQATKEKKNSESFNGNRFEIMTACW